MVAFAENIECVKPTDGRVSGLGMHGADSLVGTQVIRVTYNTNISLLMLQGDGLRPFRIRAAFGKECGRKAGFLIFCCF